MKHFILMEQLKNLQKSISRLNSKQTMTLSESIRDLQNRIRLLKESETITNTPIPETANGDYPKNLIRILRGVEINGLTLSYSRIGKAKKNNIGLRYVIDVNQNQNYFGANVISKNERSALYTAMMNYIVNKKQYKTVKFTGSEKKIDDNLIYIKTTRIGEETIGSILGTNNITTHVPGGFSTAGGLEFYVPTEKRSYFVDFEIKGSARADSAVNTKLREVTPCILFCLYHKNNKSFFRQLFANPEYHFDSIKNDILSMDPNDRLLGLSLPNVTMAILANTFDFDINSPNNGFRKNAFVVGVKTLEQVFNKYGKQNIAYIKFTGLATMTGGSSGSTEDIVVVKKSSGNKKPEEVKISLKSGAYKSRDTTFLRLLSMFDNVNGMHTSIKFVNGPTKAAIDEVNNNFTLRVNENETNPKNVADGLFKILNYINSIDEKTFASVIKKLILPDEHMEIWNVTQNDFEDLKPQYQEFYKYQNITLEQKPGTQYYVIVMSNPSNKHLSQYNRSFRLRWYKRSGKGLLGEYKLIAEPNKQ